MNALDDSANTDGCTLYEDSANFLKDQRFTKTEYQTSDWKPLKTWAIASKRGKCVPTTRMLKMQSQKNLPY